MVWGTFTCHKLAETHRNPSAVTPSKGGQFVASMQLPGFIDLSDDEE
jgi:hypothetical protein